ncbi:unnamed protein product [Trichobilharzia regenti]|nr:unnamed protein product [Trichobilharzia regenti]
MNDSSSCLRRLFTSSLFNMDMAIQYLFRSEDISVQTYLGKFSQNTIFLFTLHFVLNEVSLLLLLLFPCVPSGT